MPAAGKSRKGVFKMKKLLLVMLVPVMVLGMMGCGGNLETGTEIPEWLQGYWVTSAAPDASSILFSANEATLFSAVTPGPSTVKMAYRVEYKGPTDYLKVSDTGATGSANNIAANAEGYKKDDRFSLTFTRIVDGVTLGTLNAGNLRVDATAGTFDVYLFPAATKPVALAENWDEGWKAGDAPYYELFGVLFGTDLSGPMGNAPILFTRQ
jgi:hypothetical protein